MHHTHKETFWYILEGCFVNFLTITSVTEIQFTNRCCHSVYFQAQKKYGVNDDVKILEPRDIASAVIYAVTQPPHCTVSEVMVEPIDAPFWGRLKFSS